MWLAAGKRSRRLCYPELERVINYIAYDYLRSYHVISSRLYHFQFKFRMNFCGRGRSQRSLVGCERSERLCYRELERVTDYIACKLMIMYVVRTICHLFSIVSLSI